MPRRRTSDTTSPTRRRRSERRASLERERQTGVEPPQYKLRILTPRQRLAGRITAIVTLIALPICGVLFFAIPFAKWAYDESHVVTLTCTVESARGAVSDGGLRRGGSYKSVIIETKDCGSLVIRGFGGRDYVDVARSISSRPGPYEIVVGESDWALRDHWTSFGGAPRVKAYEQVE